MDRLPTTYAPSTLDARHDGRRTGQGGGRTVRLKRAVSAGMGRWRREGVSARGAREYFEAGEPLAPTAYVLEGGAPKTAPDQHPNGDGPSRGVLRRLPRRRPLSEIEDAYTSPPMLKTAVFRPGRIKVAGRFVLWLVAVFYWLLARVFDKALRRDTVERQARRLREILERRGGAGIKIGQQLSLRTDILPYAYGVELTKLLDKLAPFPFEYAVGRVERQTGKRLDEIFSAFDPNPVGSASIACVYQAVLKNGEKVAVKVRRPGIGETIVADCQALAWLLKTLEILTLIRPGLSRNFLFEFRTMLVEELDFVQEARYAELFRRRAKKHLRFATAPRVHFDLSGHDVLVAEFVSGVWISEMIAAVEQNDEATLGHLRQLNINPEVVAKRLIRAHHFNLFENIMFHADPHPANVLVAPGNKLIFIDFGSCGAFTTKELHLWRKFIEYEGREDVGRMAQCALALLEPLPHLDIDELTKKLEAAYWQDLYSLKSKHSKWYERTSARTWISLLKLAHEYEVTLNFNTLRVIRATLLYDTVAARLYSGMDSFREHRKYNKSAGRRARRRVKKSLFRRLAGGLRGTDYQRIEQLADIGDRMIYITQRFMNAPPFRYTMLTAKSVYAVMNIIKTFTTIAAAALTASLVAVAYNLIFTPGYGLMSVEPLAVVKGVLSSNLFIAFVLFVTYLNLRRTRFRLHDKEIHRGNTSSLS